MSKKGGEKNGKKQMGNIEVFSEVQNKWNFKKNLHLLNKFILDEVSIFFLWVDDTIPEKLFMAMKKCWSRNFSTKTQQMKANPYHDFNKTD